mmetsp:Transcript_31762/g.64640  ORF Transcript_31762/g.64640 Transcript_31762/m.64640 type:complete len:174 (+) Transcript_31762:1338-1859(+)
MMYLSALLLIVLSNAHISSAFAPSAPAIVRQTSRRDTSRIFAETDATSGSSTDDADVPVAAPTPATAPTLKKNKTSLGLITFDLDDTLYPVSPVFMDANQAFANAVSLCLCLVVNNHCIFRGCVFPSPPQSHCIHCPHLEKIDMLDHSLKKLRCIATDFRVSSPTTLQRLDGR